LVALNVEKESEMDYTTISGAVDWAGVLTGIGVVAAALAGLFVAIKGSRVLLRFIK